MEYTHKEEMKDEIVGLRKSLGERSLLNELLLRKLHEFNTNHEQMRQEFNAKVDSIEKEKEKFVRLMHSQRKITNELELRGSKEMERVRGQKDIMMEKQEKMREYLERLMKIREKLKEIAERTINQAGIILKQESVDKKEGMKLQKRMLKKNEINEVGKDEGEKEVEEEGEDEEEKEVEEEIEEERENESENEVDGEGKAGGEKEGEGEKEVEEEEGGKELEEGGQEPEREEDEGERENKTSKMLEDNMHYYHHKQEKEQQGRESAEKEKISHLERYTQDMENCLAEKELEMWNLKQLLRNNSFQVAHVTANILTKSAVEIEMRNSKIEGLKKENEELKARIELLVDEKCQLKKKAEKLEKQILEHDQTVKPDSTNIDVTQAILNEADCKTGAQKRLCEAETSGRSVEFSAKDMEKKCRESEEERDLLIKYFKEIVLSKQDLLKATNNLTKKVGIQNKRLLAVEEKFGQIEKQCLRVQNRNETVMDGMRLIEDTMKRIRDIKRERKERKKNVLQRFIAGVRNRN